MAIPPWAIEVLRRGVGGVMERVPPEKVEQLKEKASSLLAEIPQTAARGVDSVLRSMKGGRDQLQRWARRHTALVTPVVNGTGCLVDSRIAGVPVGQECVEILAEAWMSGASRSSIAESRLAGRITKLLPGSGHSLLIAHSLDAALAAVSGAAAGASIYVHRNQSFRLAGGLPVPDALKFTSDIASRFHEVGAVDRVSPEDGQTIQTSDAQPAMLIAVNRGQQDANWFDLQPSQPSRPAIRVCVLMHASWTSLSGEGQPFGEVEPKLPSVTDALADGADILVVGGDGLLGGPRCGLIIGKSAMLDRIRSSPFWSLVRADLGTQAAVVSVLNAWTEGNLDQLPVLSMIQTSKANFESRGQRLSTRLSAEPLVADVSLTNHPARLCADSPWQLPSVQLRLRHRDLSAKDWANKLANEVPALLVNVDDDSLVLDLRWIQPVDDVALVSALVGHETVGETSPVST